MGIVGKAPLRLPFTFVILLRRVRVEDLFWCLAHSFFLIYSLNYRNLFQTLHPKCPSFKFSTIIAHICEYNKNH